MIGLSEVAPRQLRVPVAERLAHEWPLTLEALCRQFGLPTYDTGPEPDCLPIDIDRLMREAPKPGRAQEGEPA